MELIYSTNVLSDAERLSSLLTGAGLLNHVSGVNAAQLPGFFAARTPNYVGVWLAGQTQVPQARDIMRSHGFLEESIGAPPSWLGSFWFRAAVIAAIAFIVALAAYGS
jgi:hypothetical protein